MSFVSAYLYLSGAIVLEVIGTSALLASQQLSRPGPTALVVVCYAAALALISLTFRVLPMGIVYALWSGLGIVLIAMIGWLGFGQRLDQPAVVGMALIIAGCVIVNVFSKTLAH